MALGAIRLDPDDPWVGWAAESVERATGKRVAVLPNLGGSRPDDAVADALGLPTLWVAPSHAACTEHAPDERLPGPPAREGLGLMAARPADLSRSRRT